MFDKILVSVDESTQASPVLNAAAAMTTSHGAEIRVCMCSKPRSLDGREWPTPRARASFPLCHRGDSDARESSGEGVGGSSAQPCTVASRSKSTTRRPPTGVGMSIMGSRGLTYLESVVVDRTSHRVLHVSTIPVLVVP